MTDGIRRVAFDVMKQMNDSSKVISSWQVHVATSFPDGEQFLCRRIRQAVQQACNLNTSETMLALEVLNFLPSGRVISFSPLEISRKR